jgi:hypothetical protein
MGHLEIDVLAYDVDDEKAELMEIDENLARIDLTYLERCLSFSRRKKLEAQRGTSGFVRKLAQQLRCGRSTIAEEVALGDKLAPQLAQLLHGHEIANFKQQLKLLAEYALEQQLETAKRLVAGELRSVPPKTTPVPPPPESGKQTGDKVVAPKSKAAARETARESDAQRDGLDSQPPDSPDHPQEILMESVSSTMALPRIFEDGPKLVEVASLLLRATGILEVVVTGWAAATTPDVEELLPRARFTVDTLRGLATEVAHDWVPVQVCPKCEGADRAGCVCCTGTGWMSKSAIGDFDEEADGNESLAIGGDE